MAGEPHVILIEKSDQTAAALLYAQIAGKDCPARTLFRKSVRLTCSRNLDD